MIEQHLSSYIDGWIIIWANNWVMANINFIDEVNHTKIGFLLNDSPTFYWGGCKDRKMLRVRDSERETDRQSDTLRHRYSFTLHIIQNQQKKQTKSTPDTSNSDTPTLTNIHNDKVKAQIKQKTHKSSIG